MLENLNKGKSLKNVLLDKRVLKILLVINLLGTFYGFYWYKEQLLNTPFFLWMLVPDSPLAAFLFVLTLWCLVYEVALPVLFLLSFAQLIKYGVWAVFVNLYYWQITGEVHWQEVILVVSHLGMVLEGLLYMLIFLPGLNEWILTGMWQIFNDIADYRWGIYPYLYLQEQSLVVERFTYLLTAIVLALTGWAVWKKESDYSKMF